MNCISLNRACKLLPMTTSGEAMMSGAGSFRPASSIAGDVWHGVAPTPAYEWWYFDALSHDGRDALVIIFLTNFVFSPRYNRAAAVSLQQPREQSSVGQFPAVAVWLYRDGRPFLRAINEYSFDEFQASTEQPECHIARNSFRLIESESQPVYELRIETKLRSNKLLRARLNWAIESGDLFAETSDTVTDSSAHHWNMVAPRCAVSGEVVVTNRNGQRSFAHDFRGTGYHDHNLDARWMPATIAEWQWGRFHFSGATAVFYRYRERGDKQERTQLYLIRDNTLTGFTPHIELRDSRRHFFGLRYPKLLQFQSDGETDGPILRVRQGRVIDSSFFYLRFLSTAMLAAVDGQIEQATGITEHLAPRSLGYNALRWLINMRIGRDGRAAFLP